jgi:hypothetical protein
VCSLIEWFRAVYYSGDEDRRTMAKAAIGKLEEFDPSREDWTQ